MTVYRVLCSHVSDPEEINCIYTWGR